MAKLKKRNKLNRKSGSTGAVALCLIGLGGTARAQSVFAPPTSYFSPPPAVLEDQNERIGTIGSGFTSILPSFGDLFHIGPLNMDPHFDYALTYGNGIQATPGNSTSTLVQSVSPGVLFSLGRHFTLDYTPSFSFYSSRDLKNSVDQTVNFQWGTTYEDWVLGVIQTYSSADDPQVETASQTGTESYATTLNASYRFNSKMSLDMNASQAFSTADQYSSSRSWSTMEYLNYQFFPRLTGAIGAGATYNQVSAGPDILSENVQARVTIVVQNKLSLSIHGGLENDQFLGGLGSQLNPVFGATASYAPFHYTTFSLSAQRALTPSLFQSQAAVSTSFNLNFSQRFFKRFNYTAGVSYANTQYEASAIQTTPPTILPNRTDNYYTLSSGLSWQFLKRATASITYQYSQDASSQGTNYSFSSSQIGLQVGYRF